MPQPTPLHVVTGKGGTGKTTVAASLAMSLARTGRRVLLCEVENRQGIAQLFDIAPLPFEERRIAVGLGGEVYALAIEAEAALLEYLELFYKLGRAGKALDKFGAIDFATTVAPGVRDVLLTGKIYEIAQWRHNPNRPGRSYDAIVLDAPPTGRITRFLNVTSEVAGLAKVGPIRKQADSIMTMMRAPSTQVHFVTVAEEMPVQETLDGIADMAASGLRVGSVVVNQVRTRRLAEATTAGLSEGTLSARKVGASLASVGLDPALAGSLVQGGRDHLARQSVEAEQRARLTEARRPIIELPLLPEIDLGALIELAERIGDLR